jgi:hypothetical protein
MILIKKVVSVEREYNLRVKPSFRAPGIAAYSVCNIVWKSAVTNVGENRVKRLEVMSEK